MNKALELKLAYTVEMLNGSIAKHNEIKTLIEDCIQYQKDVGPNIGGGPIINKWDEPFAEIEEILADVKLVMQKVCDQKLANKW